MKMDKKLMVIAGGGPAGLTLAYELAKTSESIHPVVLEATPLFGGISRTESYKDNFIDIGGHRFFSKLQRIVDIWKGIMPVQSAPAKDDPDFGSLQTTTKKKGKPEGIKGNPELSDNVFLQRRRVSRIYFNNKFFDYPVTLRLETLKAMGFRTTVESLVGFLKAKISPRPETSLENFYINRFGKPLYEMFFENYTEKVWGIHPSRLSADWGSQRVKSLSLWSVISDMANKKLKGRNKKKSEIETSLIESFNYPKFGPGQMWSLMAEKAIEKGADIRTEEKVIKIHVGRDRRIEAVTVRTPDGRVKRIECDFFASSLPLCELIESLEGIEVPEEIRRISEGLVYRDFITAGILLPKLSLRNNTKIKTIGNRIPDTWIYIQDPKVRLGRIQIFNNWSPYIVADNENTMWIGLEYFCNEGDNLWTMPEEDFIRMAVSELETLGIASAKDVMETVRIRQRKAYPSYSGTYPEIQKLRDFLDSIPNLFCIGRNGQHRYNNMDHSMMTGLLTADYLSGVLKDRKPIWNVNTETDYNEEK